MYMTLMFLLFCKISVVSAESWNLWRVQAITLSFAKQMKVKCIIIVEAKKSSHLEKAQNLKFAIKLAKLKDSPLVGLSTLQPNGHNFLRHDHCVGPLFVLLLQNDSISEIVQLSKSYSFTHSLWLIFDNATHVSEARLLLDSCVFVVEKTNMDVVVIKQLYSVDENSATISSIFAFWSEKDGLTVLSMQILRSRGNLNGKQLRTTSMENWPVSSYSNRLINDGRVFDGYFIQIWLELEDILNFTSEYVKPVDDEMPGVQVNNGSWTGLLGMISSGEVDVLLTEFSLSSSRLQIVEFLSPLLITNYQFYLRLDGYHIEWKAVLNPFSTAVWIALTSWVFISALTYFFIDRTTEQQLLKITKDDKYKFVLATYFVLQTLSSQGCSQVPKGFPLRWTCTVCYLTAYVLLSSYSGALISALTKSTATLPFDSLEGLLINKYPLLVWPNTADYEIFSEASDKLYQGIFELVNPREEMKNLRSYKEMYNYMCSHDDVAMFGGERSLNVLVREYKDRSNNGCWPKKFAKGSFKQYETIAFARNTSYIKIFNHKLLLMREFGLLSRWRRQYFPPWAPAPATPTFSVGAHQVMSLFVFLLTGIFLSVFILFAETLNDWPKFNINFVTHH